VKDNVIVDVAPIGRWMIGKSFVQVEKWIRDKQGNIVKVNEENRQGSEA